MTYAEFRRRAATGSMSLELIEGFGCAGDDIPAAMRGVRKVIGTKSKGVVLLNSNGQESELHIDSAKLVEYTGDTLTVYQKGERKPTEAEQKVLDAWNKIQKEYERQNPFGDCYWKRKDYFEKSEYPYMSGFDTVRGKSYLSHNGMVLDNQVRGDVIFRYRVHV